LKRAYERAQSDGERRRCFAAVEENAQRAYELAVNKQSIRTSKPGVSKAKLAQSKAKVAQSKRRSLTT